MSLANEPAVLPVAELQTLPHKPYRTHEIEASIVEASIGTGRYWLLDETIKTDHQVGGNAEGRQLLVFCVREGYR
jgi:hypothetical protein